MTRPVRRRLPRQEWPSLIESDYAGRLTAVVDRMRAAAERVLVPRLPSILSAVPSVSSVGRGPLPMSSMFEALLGRLDADDADRSIAEIRAQLDERAVPGLARDIARRTTDHQRGQLQRQARAKLGGEVLLRDRGVPAVVEGFVRENVALIKSLRDKPLADLEVMIGRAYADGVRAEDLAKQIRARFGTEETRARTIARDQLGKLTGAVNRVRQNELGVTKYRWRTMRDPHVRPDHAVLEGLTFYWNAPPKNRRGVPITPGSDIHCRCYAEPEFDEVLGALMATAIGPSVIPVRPTTRRRRR